MQILIWILINNYENTKTAIEDLYLMHIINNKYHIKDLFISYFGPEKAYHAFLRSVIAQILNGDINVLRLYIIVYKMKQQITENEENLIFGKIVQALNKLISFP